MDSLTVIVERVPQQGLLLHSTKRMQVLQGHLGDGSIETGIFIAAKVKSLPVRAFGDRRSD
jgi:hypothetical protein